MLLSIVIPMYNEADGVETFHFKKLMPAIGKVTNNSYEIIYINDGSKDDTLRLLSKIAQKNQHVKVINLSRNFGKEIATTAGICTAQGEATVIMDGDGQHPPEILTDFIKKWKDGTQVVVGVRSSNQQEGIVKKWGSKVFYKLFNAVTESEIVPKSTDYRLIDQAVREEFVRFNERHRITRGLIDWLGFERDYITFHSPARIAGEASYSVKQLVTLALNSFTSLSLRPLFFFGWIGAIITTLSFFIGTFIVVNNLAGDPLHLGITGSAALGVATSFLVGLVLTSQGIMAIYLSHVHAQTQDRPLYVIDPHKSINLTKPTK